MACDSACFKCNSFEVFTKLHPSPPSASNSRRESPKSHHAAASNSGRLMRIIIVADNASSHFGGEAFIPLNYFRLLRARSTDVRLVVHARNKSELIERFPDDKDRLYFVEDTALHKVLFRLGQYLPRRLADATTGLVIHLNYRSGVSYAISSRCTTSMSFINLFPFRPKLLRRCG